MLPRTNSSLALDPMAPHGSHTSLIAWQPPPTSTCSLNVDASVNSSTSLSTMGSVIRTEEGVCLLSFDSIQVQSDNAQAIRLLHDPETSHCTFPLIDAISTLRDQN
ncbi:hypothetical protein V6N13_102422 [Hibiscus sabdariffa]